MPSGRPFRGQEVKRNGQWSMPVRHKASPFWAQAVKKKYVHWFSHAISHVSPHLAKSVKNLQKVHSSDDDISLPLAMVPNLCIDKRLGLIVPGVRSPSPTRSVNGQMDSKQEFFGTQKFK